MELIKKIKKNSFNYFKNIFLHDSERHSFVISKIKSLSTGLTILDAGCGSQPYKIYCDHLLYKSQDFGEYDEDEARSFTDGRHSVNGRNVYKYGTLDYKGNIWNIDCSDESFDAILCTEVLEHIPYPNETIRELVRCLKKNGILILTIPSNSLRHFDPYYYYSGFSDNYLTKICDDVGLEILDMQVAGDYYSWMTVEIARTIRLHGLFSALLLLPALLFFYSQKKTIESTNTLCQGYFLSAKKK